MRRAGGEQRHDLEGKPCRRKGDVFWGMVIFKASPKEEELKKEKKKRKRKKKAGVLELKLR